MTKNQIENIGRNLRALVRGATTSEVIVGQAEVEEEPCQAVCEPCPEAQPIETAEEGFAHRRLVRAAVEAEDPRLEMAMGAIGLVHWCLGRLVVCLSACLRQRRDRRRQGIRLRLT